MTDINRDKLLKSVYTRWQVNGGYIHKRDLPKIVDKLIEIYKSNNISENEYLNKLNDLVIFQTEAMQSNGKEYMRGLANGLILSRATYLDIKPEYMATPLGDTDDREGTSCRNICNILFLFFNIFYCITFTYSVG